MTQTAQTSAHLIDGTTHAVAAPDAWRPKRLALLRREKDLNRGLPQLLILADSFNGVTVHLEHRDVSFRRHLPLSSPARAWCAGREVRDRADRTAAGVRLSHRGRRGGQRDPAVPGNRGRRPGAAVDGDGGDGRCRPGTGAARSDGDDRLPGGRRRRLSQILPVFCVRVDGRRRNSQAACGLARIRGSLCRLPAGGVPIRSASRTSVAPVDVCCTAG